MAREREGNIAEKDRGNELWKKRSSHEIARSIRKKDEQGKKSRYDMAFDFVVELLHERQPHTQIHENKVDRLRHNYNIDRIVRMLLKSKDFDGNLSVEKFSELFDQWILPRIASGSFIRSAERYALTQGWKFDNFLEKYGGKNIPDVHFTNDIDRIFGALFAGLKERHKNIKVITVEPIRIKSFGGTVARADAHMTLFTDHGVESIPGDGKAEEGKRHTEMMQELVQGIKELTNLDLSDKTVALSTQHEAKFFAVAAMLERAEQFLKKASSEGGGDDEAQDEQKKANTSVSSKSQIRKKSR